MRIGLHEAVPDERIAQGRRGPQGDELLLIVQCSSAFAGTVLLPSALVS